MTLNAYELARELEVSHTTIYTWVEKGLPFEHVTNGKRISMRFDLDKAKEWSKEYAQKIEQEAK